MTLPSTHRVQTPFDSVENAQAYIQLLLGTLAEARKEIAADAASAASTRSERRLQALRPRELRPRSLRPRSPCRDRLRLPSTGSAG